MPDHVILGNTIQPITTWNDTDTITGADNAWYHYKSPDYQEPVVISTPYYSPIQSDYNWWRKENNKKGDDDMQYLYEVILVNPKNDTFYVEQYIARSETSALMEIYHNSQFDGNIKFDDLKTSCRILMEWKKEKSLKKAIETIKKAVE